MCSFRQRCLKTRSGKSVCVQDERQNYPEKSSPRHVNKQKTFGNSSLHEACRKGNLTRVKRILSQSLLDINRGDGNHGKTPLMVAAQEGHCRIFALLIKKGADKSQVDDDGKNILQWACTGGHVGMVECLLPEYGVSNKVLPSILFAAWQGYRDVCEFLVCMGANVAQVDDSGDNGLHWGCKRGQLGVLKYLLSLGRLDINSRGQTGWTPLMIAASSGHRNVFDFLWKMGANASLVVDDNNNVLHVASNAGREEIVMHIVRENMVDIKARNKAGRTAAMIAKRKQNHRIYNFLRRNGCPGK